MHGALCRVVASQDIFLFHYYVCRFIFQYKCVSLCRWAWKHTYTIRSPFQQSKIQEKGGRLQLHFQGTNFKWVWDIYSSSGDWLRCLEMLATVQIQLLAGHRPSGEKMLGLPILDFFLHLKMLLPFLKVSCLTLLAPKSHCLGEQLWPPCSCAFTLYCLQGTRK